MKIKHNFSISLKQHLIFFSVFSIICIAVRTLQMFKYIDHETGFTAGGEFFNVILYGVILVALLFFSLTSYLSKDAEKIDIHNIKNPLAACFTLVFAASLIYDWINSILLSVTALNNTPAYGGMKALMSSGSIPAMLQSIFALFSAVYFFIVGFDFLKGRNKAVKFKILAIMPVGWAGMKLIYRFVKQISFVEISDLLLELVMIGLTIMMFMAFAQVNSGVYSDGFAWRITGFGLPAALIAICISASRLVFTIAKGSESVNADYQFNVTDLCFALFIVGITIAIISKLYKQQKQRISVSEN